MLLGYPYYGGSVRNKADIVEKTTLLYITNAVRTECIDSNLWLCCSNDNGGIRYNMQARRLYYAVSSLRSGGVAWRCERGLSMRLWRWSPATGSLPQGLRLVRMLSAPRNRYAVHRR